MKKILTILSVTALLGLAACGGDTVEEGDTTIVEGDSAPAMSAPVDSSAPVAEADGDGDSFSISKDGVRADIDDGDTSISVDADGDPSLTVSTD